jgi:hypothetical protein
VVPSLGTRSPAVDEHTVGPPVAESEPAALRQRLPWIPDDLLTVARWVGEVSLPDIAAADGGGTLCAIAVGDIDTVYRLRECGYEQGVHSGSAGFGVTVVAEGLDAFLDASLAAVAAFAVHGEITDL